jgi:adenosine kinase
VTLPFAAPAPGDGRTGLDCFANLVEGLPLPDDHGDATSSLTGGAPSATRSHRDMRIACTGSIANDYLMTFPGRFHEQLVDDQLQRLSLSFLVDSLEVRIGGVAANIAFGMGALGHRPILVGAVGHDFPAEHERWLRDHNVDLASVRVSETLYTGRFLCTNDQVESQIASFYPGAMEEAREIALGPIAERVGGLELVVVSPNDPVAMARHTAEAHDLGIDVLADPSQQIARLDGDALRPLVDGAAYLIGNDYERSLIERKTGWTADALLDRVGVCITTHGPKGCHIERADDGRVVVDAVPVRDDVELEPTGAGDGFRAGFLAGLSWGLDLERCAQIGALLGVMALESVGPQSYTVDPQIAHERLTGAYGEDVADEIVALLPAGDAAPDGQQRTRLASASEVAPRWPQG